GHALLGVVDHHAQLVRRRRRRLPHHEVAAGLLQVHRAGAAEEVVEGRYFIWQAEPPAVRAVEPRRVAGAAGGAGAGVAGALVVEVRGAGGALDVAAGAGAGVDALGGAEARQGRLVPRQPARLHHHDTVEIQAQPGQVLDRLLGGAGLDSRAVDVL